MFNMVGAHIMIILYMRRVLQMPLISYNVDSCSVQLELFTVLEGVNEINVFHSSLICSGRLSLGISSNKFDRV